MDNTKKRSSRNKEVGKGKRRSKDSNKISANKKTDETEEKKGVEGEDRVSILTFVWFNVCHYEHLLEVPELTEVVHREPQHNPGFDIEAKNHYVWECVYDAKEGVRYFTRPKLIVGFEAITSDDDEDEICRYYKIFYGEGESEKEEDESERETPTCKPVSLNVQGSLDEVPVVKALGKLVPILSPTLSILKLVDCALTARCVSILAKAIGKENCIEYVYLDRNPKNFEQNFHLLLKNKTIKLLSLRYCNINDVGAKLLAESLSWNDVPKQYLKTLDLTGNNITSAGCEELASALRWNRCLEKLILIGNKIRNRGAIELATILCPFKLTKIEIKMRLKRLLKREHLLNFCIAQRYDERIRHVLTRWVKDDSGYANAYNIHQKQLLDFSVRQELIEIFGLQLVTIMEKHFKKRVNSSYIDERLESVSKFIENIEREEKMVSTDYDDESEDEEVKKEKIANKKMENEILKEQEKEKEGSLGEEESKGSEEDKDEQKSGDLKEDVLDGDEVYERWLAREKLGLNEMKPRPEIIPPKRSAILKKKLLRYLAKPEVLNELKASDAFQKFRAEYLKRKFYDKNNVKGAPKMVTNPKRGNYKHAKLSRMTKSDRELILEMVNILAKEPIEVLKKMHSVLDDYYWNEKSNKPVIHMLEEPSDDSKDSFDEVCSSLTTTSETISSNETWSSFGVLPGRVYDDDMRTISTDRKEFQIFYHQVKSIIEYLNSPNIGRGELLDHEVCMLYNELFSFAEKITPPDIHPIAAEVRDFETNSWCYGNYILKHLNISFNRVGKKAFTKFLSVFNYRQTQKALQNERVNFIFMGNRLSQNEPLYQEIVSILEAPLPNAPSSADKISREDSSLI